MHYFKRNIGDYAKKAGRLSMLQHGAYTLLLDACYDREQFPTLDEAIEWTWASTSEEEEAVKFVLRKFFVLENGVYVQKRIQEEIAEYHDKAETNKRIAIEREAKRKGNSTKRAPDVHEPPPNHKPLTINQEPINHISVPDGTGAIAPIVSNMEINRREVWDIAKRLCDAAGVKDEKYRPMLGKMVKDYGIEVMLEAVRTAEPEKPLDPLPYLKSICQRITGERAKVVKNSRHNGFDKIDYSEGVGADGRLD